MLSLAKFSNSRFANRPLYVLAFMILCFGIFDGLVAYIVPLSITRSGLSNTIMGLIISSSSLFGIGFDLVLYKLFKDFRYRRIYLVMFGLCALFPLVIWQAKTVAWFIVGMAIWGLYYDLFNIGNLDFVARKFARSQHASSFGFMNIFLGLGCLIGPLLCGVLISQQLDGRPFIVAYFFIALAFAALLILLVQTRFGREKFKAELPIKTHNLFSEFRLWRKVGRFIFPVLLTSVILNIIEAFFWTLGPLLSESRPELARWGGLILPVYILPFIFEGLFISRVTKPIGKKRTAFISLLIGSIFLSAFFLVHSAWFLVLLVFISSCFLSLAWPAISGAYADYVSDVPRLEKEVVLLRDSFINLGFIIGPVLAGIISDLVSDQGAFSVLGVMGIVVAIILLKITPRHIKIKVRPADYRG